MPVHRAQGRLLEFLLKGTVLNNAVGSLACAVWYVDHGLLRAPGSGLDNVSPTKKSSLPPISPYIYPVLSSHLGYFQISVFPSILEPISHPPKSPFP